MSKDNADGVARHLVMAGRLLDDDPEAAYAHAQAAVRRAGRVDVVREAAGITAYRTGRYAEALRELRTARRLSGSDEHVPIMADCERGLGRPERAIALAQEQGARLSIPAQIELTIVVSGARLDMGQPDAALAALSAPMLRQATGDVRWRVVEARAEALRSLGRQEEADALLQTIPVPVEVEDVVVVDLAEEAGAVEESGSAGRPDLAEESGAAGGERASDDVVARADDEPTEESR